MATNFSFGALTRHIKEGSAPDKSAHSPTAEHMLKVMHGYIANVSVQDPAFWMNHVAEGCTGADPVGSFPSVAGDAEETFAEAVERLIDVPVVLKKAELISPVSFSLENQAAMAFRAWADVDGTNISIDIMDVMTFDASGKICDIRAYWSLDNVTVLD